MKLKRATEIMENDKACAAVAMNCFEDGNPCGICKYYADPDKLEEARWTALRIMQAWTAATEDIRKACGCSTALDIMEKYQKEAEEGET